MDTAGQLSQQMLHRQSWTTESTRLPKIITIFSKEKKFIATKHLKKRNLLQTGK